MMTGFNLAPLKHIVKLKRLSLCLLTFCHQIIRLSCFVCVTAPPFSQSHDGVFVCPQTLTNRVPLRKQRRSPLQLHGDLCTPPSAVAPEAPPPHLLLSDWLTPPTPHMAANEEQRSVTTVTTYIYFKGGVWIPRPPPPSSVMSQQMLWHQLWHRWWGHGHSAFCALAHSLLWKLE